MIRTIRPGGRLGDDASGASSFGYNPDGTPDCTSFWSYVNPVLNAQCLPGAAVTAGGEVVQGAVAATISQATGTSGGSGVPSWVWFGGAAILVGALVLGAKK